VTVKLISGDIVKSSAGWWNVLANDCLGKSVESTQNSENYAFPFIICVNLRVYCASDVT